MYMVEINKDEDCGEISLCVCTSQGDQSPPQAVSRIQMIQNKMMTILVGVVMIMITNCEQR